MPKRQIFADYFTNFKTRAISQKSDTWRYYASDKVQWSGDLYEAPGSTRKQISSPYYPLIGPYDTLDPDVMEYHILLAKLAGLDGFFCEYDIAHGHSSQVPIRMARLGKKYAFQVGIHWVPINFTNREPDLKDRVQMLAAAQKCLLTALEQIYRVSGILLDGHPAILFFGIRAADYLPTVVRDTFFSASELQALRQAAKKYRPWFFTPHFEEELLPFVDGFYPWVLPYGSEVPAQSAYDRIGDLASQRKHLHHFYSSCQKARANSGLQQLMGGVWPGFDDHRGRAWNEDLARLVPRENGKTFQLTWDMAKASGADTLLQVTWNDWVESTMIEPSREMKYRELAATQKQISLWKNQPLSAKSLIWPRRLLAIRKHIRQFENLNLPEARLEKIRIQAESAAQLLAQGAWQEAARIIDLAAVRIRRDCLPRLRTRMASRSWSAGKSRSAFLPITAPLKSSSLPQPAAGPFQEFSNPLTFGLALSLPATRNWIEGRLRIKYFDHGSNYLLIKQGFGNKPNTPWEIANFRKQNTLVVRTVELDLVPFVATARENRLFLAFASDGLSDAEWLHSFRLVLRSTAYPA